MVALPPKGMYPNSMSPTLFQLSGSAEVVV